MKKIFRTLIIILVIVAVGFAAYWFFDKQERGEGINLENLTEYLPFGRGSEEVPFNNEPGSTNTPGSNTGTNNNSSEAVRPPQLWQISTEAQSGAVMFEAEGQSNNTQVRYIDKATGNVYQSSLAFIEKNRVTNTTIPKIAEALWLGDGNSVVLRYTDTSEMIKNFYAELVAPPATTTIDTEEVGELQELRGSFVTGNITGVAIEPGKTGNERALYLSEGTNGVVGFVSNPDGTRATTIFNSPLRDWLVSWPKRDTVTVTTKASGGIPGYLYFINSTSGNMRRILGNINGLTTLTNPDASRVLFSESGATSLTLGVQNVTGTTTRLMLTQTTLPEKCVWSKRDTAIVYCATPKSIPNAKYPDTWYQGTVSFNDVIWKINTTNQQSEIISDPRDMAGVDVDAIELSLSENENYLIFTNKKDYKLWGLRILEVGS